MYIIDTCSCIGCGGCPPICPDCAIYDMYEYCVINGSRCVNCENCWAICPTDSISRLPDADPDPDYFDSYWDGDMLMDLVLWWWGVPYADTPDFSDWSKGADCSWTVWKIYQQAGLNYPYTSTGWAWDHGMPYPFVEIAPGDFQDGDILLFRNHMAIYVEHLPSGVSNPEAHWFNARRSSWSHEFNTLEELTNAVGSDYKVFRWENH